MNLRKNISNLRKQKGYSLQKLADLSGLSKSHIWELENKQSNPTAQTVYKIAQVLETTTDFLLSKSNNAYEARKKAFFNKIDKLSRKDRNRVFKIINIIGE